MDELPPNFYPVLQPADWPGQEMCLNRPLLAADPSCPLLLSFAIVTEIANQAMPAAALEGTGMGLEDVEELATNNWLASFAEAEWDIMEPAEGVTVLCARTESDVFSSGIVSHGIRKGIHRSLGAEMIHIGVPDRFTIMASAEPIQFSLVVAGMYQDALDSGMAPLCPNVFVSNKGDLVGWAGPQ